MRIGDVAHHAGVTVKTIRHYERIGILAPATREANGYRSYEPEVLGRLAFTRSAQAVGLSLGEIREVIGFRDRGEPPCAHVLNLIELRSNELTDRITELEALRADLEVLSERGRSLDPRKCSPSSICHIIRPTG